MPHISIIGNEEDKERERGREGVAMRLILV